ncbi:MAG: hypothetical protein KC766_28270 [Myxococcales bacterium]|nr:hypothetical protein [Myxococcales bacterium]
MSFLRGLGSVVLAASLALGATGCIKKALLNGQIKGTRDGSAAVNTIHDWEVARSIAQAGVGQMEGMHRLAPDNEDALFLLTRSWAGMSFGFTEDDYEVAYEKGDDVMARYHQARERAGFERAIFYGKELLSHQAEGFDGAKRNAVTMRKWLVENFTEPEQAEDLLWVGYAWIGRVSASKEIPAIVGELYVGVEMIRRSIELDETVQYGMGHVIMGAYHARTAQAELDESKKHFDRALEINQGKFLSTQLNYATRYYCFKRDQKSYEKLLNEVLAAGDPLPEARLPNVIAKRRARRYLGNKIWQEPCGFGL